MKKSAKFIGCVSLFLAILLLSSCNLLFGPTQMVETPVISIIDNGTGQYVEITCLTPGATIYYAWGSSVYMSGMNPTMGYYGRINAGMQFSDINSTRYIYAVAKKDGMMDSVVTSKRIEKLKKPTIKYNPTLYKYEITYGDFGFQYIIYTTDGITPSMTNGIKSTSGFISIPSAGVSIVKAIEIVYDHTYQFNSDIATYYK